ncbi:MAG: hypothetical protein AAF570_27085, partial [Bacteroidota bacterium]
LLALEDTPEVQKVQIKPQRGETYPMITVSVTFGDVHLEKVRHRRHGNWRKRWEARMADMSDEEREAFREKWAGKCGPGRHRSRARSQSQAEVEDATVVDATSADSPDGPAPSTDADIPKDFE